MEIEMAAISDAEWVKLVRDEVLRALMLSPLTKNEILDLLDSLRAEVAAQPVSKVTPSV
jgi:hypothetical protein